MEIRFDGKTALVTGAGSGIGEAIALDLGAAGAMVVIADRDLPAAERVAKGITASGGRAVAAAGDVTEPAVVEHLVAVAMENGGLHLLVNNAGIGGHNLPTGEYPLDAWQQVIDVNLNAVFYGLRFGIPAMLQSGGGAIVNMASILGSVGYIGSPAYVAAKHAVVGLTKSAAAEYGAQGIRINSVGPGFIDTPLLSKLNESQRSDLVGKHPIGRLGAATEVSKLVLFLLSDHASFVTGGYHLVDGGYTSL